MVSRREALRATFASRGAGSAAAVELCEDLLGGDRLDVPVTNRLDSSIDLGFPSGTERLVAGVLDILEEHVGHYGLPIEIETESGLENLFRGG